MHIIPTGWLMNRGNDDRNAMGFTSFRPQTFFYQARTFSFEFPMGFSTSFLYKNHGTPWKIPDKTIATPVYLYHFRPKMVHLPLSRRTVMGRRLAGHGAMRPAGSSRRRVVSPATGQNGFLLGKMVIFHGKKHL